MKTLGAMIAAALLLTTSACGNSRPSTSEVSKALQDGVKSSKASDTNKLTLKKKQADCVAKVFETSKLTDATLTTMVKDHTYTQSKANDKILAGLSTKLAKCQVA